MPTAKTKAKAFAGFSDDERAAMKERAQELLADKNDGEKLLLAKMAEMQEPDRSLCERLHQIITTNAPTLSPKTWYGMPAYANSEGKVVCFFQSAKKFKARYCTLGFSDEAHLDDGTIWPTSYALTQLTAAEESKIIELIKQAVQ